MLKRLKHHQPVSTADRSHLHHRFLNIGFSQRRAAITMWAWTASLGAAVTVKGGIGYIAYPIFSMYHAMGQPLYKYLVRGLLDRLLPSRAIVTDLPSSGRATLTRQAEQKRHILHLLYGAPQVRGKAVPTGDGGTRVMEMIEDIPTLGAVTASVRLPRTPARVYDAVTGEDVPFSNGGDRVEVRLPSLRIHTALVFEGTV